eukprot:CAMPEP_0181132540 /NCGR_PEP_ID=MMETSP1071-20121207/31047_1 /TAXON_ID=35127 /ORGANISM="Thalassiosira sp., Strain NH16" /LENGTH=174 /DNA_ID=CAMNT_0023218875 /DNA_START=284 /DNA_END=805 /DNA_ORIENTATION=+
MNKRFVGSNKLDFPGGDEEMNYMIGIDRGIVLKVCLSHLKEEHPDVDILFGHRLVTIDEGKSILMTEPPLPSFKFDLLFGADGGNSKVRRCCDSIHRGSHVTPFTLDLLVKRIVSTPSDMPDQQDRGMGLYMSGKPLPSFDQAKIKSAYSPIAKNLTNQVIAGTCTFKSDEGKE